MSQLQEQVLALLPPSIKAFIDGSSRRDLLRKVDTTLLVFDNQVVHVETGRAVEFQEAAAVLDATRLASASKTLLGEAGTESSILLLLPPSSFVATTQKLPGINRESIVSALSLQSESLLPANQSPVSLAINSRAAEVLEEPTALWIRNATMMELFSAFSAQDLFVAVIKPRILNIQQGPARILDSDEATLTLVDIDQDVVTHWVQIARADLEQPEFKQQWHDVISNVSGTTQLEYSDINSYIESSDKQFQQDYSFFPQGALKARRQVEKGRKLMMAAAVLVGALFLSSIPFLLQSLQFRSLAATLESQRELSFDARQDQAVVVSFENELGPINDFPEQLVRDAMFTLQGVLSPNQLSSLEVTKGTINIQGTSTEPQSILQRLEGDPMFTEVAFSRATNNDRYYIGLRLSTINFDAYMVRYFPDE